MNATVTEPSAPAMLMKSVKVLTTMQSRVVMMMIKARRVTLLTTLMFIESCGSKINFSMMAKAARICTG